MSRAWFADGSMFQREYAPGKAKGISTMKRATSGHGRVRCSLSESLIIALLKSGAVQLEQLRCLDERSSNQLKDILLRSYTESELV